MGASGTASTWLLPALVLWPLAAALLLAAWSGAGRAGGGPLAAAATAVTLGIAGLLAGADATVTARLPALLGAIELRADAPARMFVLVASAVWFCASLYAVGYLRGDRGAARFRVAGLVLLSANLGVFVAGDWLSLLVFFEVLGLGGLLFVVHAGTDAARRAGHKYFWLTLVGGVALLAGIALLAGELGGAAIRPVPDTPAVRWAVALMLAGFGVKAGMLGVHVWLPDAHSVAPTPASALLSGVMIKAGAFGVFRCLHMLPGPAEGASLALGFGAAVLWLGLAGMLVGAVAALAQTRAKRLLAWSSISQMGFILAALGAGAMRGSGDADGGTAGLFHALNHAVLKGGLFLAVGAVMHAAGSDDLGRLGGLARRMPALFAAVLVLVAGITGLPPVNGFASKTMIHHALAGGGEIAEWCYYVASVGTAAMFVRLVHRVFLAAPAGPVAVRPVPATMLAAIWVPAVLVVVIGVRPGAVLDGLGSSGANALHVGAADLVAPWAVLLAGMLVAAAVARKSLLHWRPPVYLTADGILRCAGRRAVTACVAASEAASRLRRTGVRGFERVVGAAVRWSRLTWIDSARIAARGAAMRLPRDTLYRELDEARDRVVARALAVAGRRVAGAGPTDRAGREKLLDATRHYAGWLATRLLNAGIDLEPRTGRELARSAATRERLAHAAVEMAAMDVGAGQGARALALADETLDSLLGPHRENPAEPMPIRHWFHELRSVLFHLLTDPHRGHWPVSENLAHGAFASRLRAGLKRLAHDPGPGLALACLLLVLLVALLAYT